MPCQIFKNRVIATAGPPPPSITLENLRSWIPLRKGRFVDSFDDDVTHLLCTHEQFKKRVPLGIIAISLQLWVDADNESILPVKQVLRDHRRVHIVHYDWLEFSAVFNKRLPEREYSMRNIFAKERAERRERNLKENGRRQGERGVNPTLFHVYQDREFFSYQINLTRNNSYDGEFGQRYILTLWESDAKPHLYWFTAKFMRRKGDPNACYHRPSPCSGKWRLEMDHFVNFFRIKAGIDWQDRVLREGTTPLSLFQYSPPTGGKPVGRRLRFSYDHCVELNLEWKRRNLPQEIDHEIENRDAEEVDGSAEDDDGDSIGDDEEGGIAIDIDEEFREVSPGAAQAIEESDEPKSKPPTSESICISPGEESTEASGDERAEPSPGPLDPPRQL